jgi:hypothetical protein
MTIYSPQTINGGLYITSPTAGTGAALMSVTATGTTISPSGVSQAIFAATGIQFPQLGGATGIIGINASGYLYETNTINNTNIINPTITGQTIFQPTGPSPINYAVTNTQIYVAKLPTGSATGVLATITVPGYSGAPITTGMVQIDTETSMTSAITNDAARFKHSWQWRAATGAVTPLGPLVVTMAAGTNSNGVPTGWNTTIQQATGTIQVISSTSTGTIDVAALVQWGYVS